MNKEELSKMHDRYTLVTRDKETGKETTTYNLTEREAAYRWEQAEIYDNIEPVSVTPKIEFLDNRNKPTKP
ncbi:hypothetical protein [Streptomyces sp. NPDC059513]|uniref:hypothetical protein n=1 Tax=unclassified Streptomyces TaxID=2593676 RepID=UPI00368DA305